MTTTTITITTTTPPPLSQSSRIPQLLSASLFAPRVKTRENRFAPRILCAGKCSCFPNSFTHTHTDTHMLSLCLYTKSRLSDGHDLLRVGGTTSSISWRPCCCLGSISVSRQPVSVTSASSPRPRPARPLPSRSIRSCPRCFERQRSRLQLRRWGSHAVVWRPRTSWTRTATSVRRWEKRSGRVREGRGCFLGRLCGSCPGRLFLRGSRPLWAETAWGSWPEELDWGGGLEVSGVREKKPWTVREHASLGTSICLGTVFRAQREEVEGGEEGEPVDS